MLWIALLRLLLPLSAAAASGTAHRCNRSEPFVTRDSPVVVVGFPSSGTPLGLRVEAGLRAALADADAYTLLHFELVSLAADSPARTADNVRDLVCDHGAFAIAATVGSESSRMAFERLRDLAMPTATRVPLVGALSNWRELRDPEEVVGGDGRVSVVNLRVGGHEELSAIVRFLWRDLDAFNRTAIVVGSSSRGGSVTEFIRTELGAMSAHPWALVDAPLPPAPGKGSVSVAEDIANAVLSPASRTKDGEAPYAVVLVATGTMTGPIIESIAAREVRGVTYVCGSDYAENSTHIVLSRPLRERLAELDSSVFFVQHMPQTTARSELIREFLRSMRRPNSTFNDSSALEGYEVGRLIAKAAMRSLEIYGWPLTRRTFLDTVFRSHRTFRMGGVVFGPYGDGEAPQTEGERCNQGGHDLFIDRLDLDTGQLVQERSSSFHFPGCTTHSMMPGRRRAIVGLSLAQSGEQSVLDSLGHLGLSAALASFNVARTSKDHVVFASNVRGPNSTANIERLLRSSPIAVVGLNSAAAPSALPVVLSDPSALAMIAPMSGDLSLRIPFRRNVINIVPLTLQEAHTAVQFIQDRWPNSSIGLVYSSDPVGREFRDAVANATAAKIVLRECSFSAPLEASCLRNTTADAYIFAGKTRDAALFLKYLHDGNSTRDRAKVICSEVPVDLLQEAVKDNGIPRSVLAGVYVMSKTPPLSSLSASSPLRRRYEQWVSDVDRGESSFRGFLVGTFVSEIVSAIDDRIPRPSESPEAITAARLVDAVYQRRMFDIGGVRVGPFIDSCEAPNEHCCNQGLDTVHILRWDGDTRVFVSDGFKAKLSKCGWDWDSKATPSQPSDRTSVGLAVSVALPLVCLVVVAACSLLVVLWHSRRTLSFLNIRRSDLEINQRISGAEGRLGVVHMGDWNGTTVAIRVIDKKDITKQELAAIKDVIALMHKLHHPNLLMLMGFCETPAELIVVCEYMPGGSLKDFLARNRGQLGVFALIAIAFDIVKGIAYLHSAKPPIVHGSISTRNMLMDGGVTTKVSDFWLSGQFGRKSSPSTPHGRANLEREDWTAPEVATGALLTPASDVWSFGVVLWELSHYNLLNDGVETTLSGNGSNSSNTSSLQMEYLALHPEPDPSTPSQIMELLYRCWEPQPDQRPTIFDILRSWPSMFASVGHFELPPELSDMCSIVDSNLLEEGPDAAVPVATMSHSEQSATQSLHFEFLDPSSKGQLPPE
eukprot:m51a1_g4934 putative pas domain-containing protein tyrosine kinase (1225) ;mRNA; r:277090-285470